MRYVVVNWDREVAYSGPSLSEAEQVARNQCQPGEPADLYALKETYEAVTTTKIQIIKQEDHHEKR